MPITLHILFKDVVKIAVGVGAVRTLIALLKFFKGRKIPDPIVVEGDFVILEIENEKIKIPKKIYELANDKDTRKALSKVVKPLSKRGLIVLVFLWRMVLKEKLLIGMIYLLFVP